MTRSKNGQAVRGQRRSRAERRRLQRFLREAERRKDLATWRRAKAVLDYLGGKRVITLSENLGVARSSINRWLIWFQAQGTDGLRTKVQAGGMARLNCSQYEELIEMIEIGPQSAGFSTGVWTGPMIGEWIYRRFGIKYHNHHIPRLLHKLGFSVQRPRRRLARADIDRQEIWLRKTFPSIKKKQRPVVGLSCSKMKPVFGLTEHSIRRGPE